MAERWHYLRGNAQCRTPKRIVCFDTETHWPQVNGEPDLTFHQWRLAVATFVELDGSDIVKHETYRFKSGEGLWSWILGKCRRKERLWIFAHNALFDLTISGFWELVQGFNVKLAKWVVNDPPTIIKGSCQQGQFTICDSMNWATHSLAKIGEWCGLPKYPMPHQSSSDIDWFDYCSRDVEILVDFMVRVISLVKECDLGNFQTTAAAQSMSAYRHRWMKHKILIHQDANVKKLERAAYYGGMVKCLYVGKCDNPTYHVDVNNLYPYVMGQGLYPTAINRRIANPSLNELDLACMSNAVIATVRINTKEMTFPYRANGLVIHPVGDYWTTLAGPELIAALDTGSVIGCSECVLYEHAPIFEQWSHDWCLWLECCKSLGQLAKYHVSKLIANALSGKWAQRSKAWIPIEGLSRRRKWGEWWCHRVGVPGMLHCRSVAGAVQYEKPDVESSSSFPAISAFITSYGRTYMQSIIDSLDPRDVYYVDTDGIFCNDAAVVCLDDDGMIDQYRPGKLKVDGTHEGVTIHGLRRYEINHRIMQPGLKPSAVETADGTYLQDAWQGGRSLLSSDPNGIVRVAKRVIHLGPARIGAHVAEDGWTFPFTIDGGKI